MPKKKLAAKRRPVKKMSKKRAKKAVKKTGVELQTGQPAPDFSVLNDEGREVRLSNFRGQKVVLYFYPKDDTPGCTVEACSFRDGMDRIREKGAVVLGVSVDPIDSHQRFKEKFGLNFPLLSDTGRRLVDSFGVWKEKSMYGNTYMGTERTTFIIDEEGKIAKVFPKVQVDRHFEEVLESL